MSLLDSFLLQFVSEGLEQLNKGVEEANESLEEFEEQSEDAEESSQELNDSVLESLDSFKKLATQATKTLLPFIILGKTISDTAQFASEALEVADAAEKAGKSLEEFQLQNGERYAIFTRDDVNNAKEYEQVMRDVRSGTKSITANISRMFLPALINLGKVVRNVVDFFVEHGTFIKLMFIGLATVITIACIPAIISMGTALLTALSPLLVALPYIIGIGAAIAGIAMIVEDLIVWVEGGESAFGDLWTEIFGGTEQAKKLFNDIKRILGEVWNVAQIALGGIAKFLGTVVFNALKATIILIDAMVKGFKALVNLISGGKLNGKVEVNGSHADGLDYVPYDGYIAKLHRGERIQTADEASDWRAGLLSAKRAINFTAQYPLNAIPQGAISTAYNSNASERSITIGDITINTQATDAQGIATDLADYIKQAVISLDDGMLA